MKLIYKDKTIQLTTTHNKGIMKYHFQKLYYAIMIYDCNRYSSIASKQRLDIVMTDENLKILSIKREMHENTVYENEEAKLTFLLPLNYFEDLKEEEYLQIKE